MPNADGKIWKDHSVTPPQGVSIGDLQAAFGMAATDVGRIVTDASINKWAKYKPLRSGKRGILTDADRAALNHGFVINKYTTISGIEGASGDWAYLRPRGLSQDELFRYDDFAHPTADLKGYIPDAESFVVSADVPSVYTKGLGGIRVQINFIPDSQLPDGNVLLADLTDVNGDNFVFEDMYLGVLLKQGSTYRYKTSTETLGDNGYWAEAFFDGTTMDALSTGSWTVYLFAAYTQCTTIQTTTGNINSQLSAGAYVFPDISAQTMTVQPNTANIVIYKMTVSEITGGIKLTSFDVKYNSGVQTPVSNVNMKLYTNLNGEDVQVGSTGGYGGSNPGGPDRTGWVISPAATPTTYYDDFGVYFQSDINLRTTYGTYLKAVLTYTVAGNTYTITRTARIGEPPVPVE